MVLFRTYLAALLTALLEFSEMVSKRPRIRLKKVPLGALCVEAEAVPELSFLLGWFALELFTLEFSGLLFLLLELTFPPVVGLPFLLLDSSGTSSSLGGGGVYR